MFLKTRYQTCEDFQNKEKKFILNNNNSNETQLSPNQWVILAVLLSYYLYLRQQQEQQIVETIRYTPGKDSNLIANLRNGINIPGISKTIQIANQTLTQNIVFTLFTVPAGKRYLLHQVISFFKTNSSLGIEYRHVNKFGNNFLLSKFNNIFSGRGLFVERIDTIPLNSANPTTLNYFNVFHPLIMFEEGESFVILNTNSTQLTNIDFKYMFWEIDAADNIPIKSFFKQVVPNTITTPVPGNELFTAESSGPAFLLSPYEYINPQSSIVSGTASLGSLGPLISSNELNSQVQQVNNGCVNFFNATNPASFNIPYFYIQDDVGNPLPVSSGFNFATGGLQMPALQIIASNVPAGKALQVENRTISGWTAGINGNFYGTYYQF